MKQQTINGYTVTIDGTWTEISNGQEVVFSSSVTEDVTPDIVYGYALANGYIK